MASSNVDGLASIVSEYGPQETADRLAGEVAARGMSVFARVDHAAGARAAGLELRPTEVFLFGNAKAGTPLMAASQTMGIDLPLKALVWQDAAGVTWLSYNEPAWLARRHHLGDEDARTIEAMSAALEAIAHKVTGRPG